MILRFTQRFNLVYWQANYVPVHRSPAPRCAAAQDVPDTSKRHLPKRPKSGPRQRNRAPIQPQAPPPMGRNSQDNLFLEPGQFDFQQQMDLMQQAFNQMSDNERQAFLAYLASQEALAVLESSASSSSSSPRSSPEQQQAPNAQHAQQQQQQQQQGPASDMLSASEARVAAAEARHKLLSEVWRLLLDSLPKRDAAILTKALPRGWYGARDLSRRDVMEGLNRLTRAELRRLPRVLKQVDELQATAGAVAAVFEQDSRLHATRRRRLAAQKGLTLPAEEDGNGEGEEEEEEEEAAAGSTVAAELTPPANLQELLGVVQRRLREQLRTIEAQEEQPLRDEDHPLQRVRLGPPDLYGDEYYKEPYVSYDEQYGVTWRCMARVFKIFRLYSELSDLVAAAAAPPRGPGGMPLTGRAAAMYEQDLEQRSDDLAAQLVAADDPWVGSGAVRRPAGVDGGATGGDEGGLALDLDEQSVARLGQFIRAAANWEAYKAFLEMYGTRHPELELGTVMRAAGMSDGDEWWVQMPDFDFGGRSSSSASAATATATPADSGVGVDDGDSLPSRPSVDWSRVEAVASLDLDVLAFLTDLEATRYSEDTFMKWYFHPVMGPRIRSGTLLDPSVRQSADGGGTGDVQDKEGKEGVPTGSGSGSRLDSGSGLLDPAALLAQLLGGGGASSAGGGGGSMPQMVVEAMEEAMRGGAGGRGGMEEALPGGEARTTTGRGSGGGNRSGDGGVAAGSGLGKAKGLGRKGTRA
ncbi:hypothetical protein VOLCADRAFT_92871 [Volvox carteri f. nagariensis]|uniref:Uncharacterized protein n=1 Tax=Volvox carteri f. nagariensis TaxID=3068 RepID=D8U0P1_VOLCA|nr:uncharacterized protein VOLCADRAFT_92871 [Volvox carteri f. nagariensis]EFJ46670.1 hypothetical protein VOLCADRAFT_92871 [Volvox carteri f. nagariensis]|eukprot:XP_002952199.1 hypothetical protein VOLCADRAFT_92871 [Volvox carteri f. nagariensis]